MGNSLKFAAYIKNKKIIIILIIVAILLVIAGVYYFSRGEKPKEETKDQPQKVDEGADFNIGVDAGNVGQGTESALKNMPSANPLEEVANPFRDAYKNPFK